MNQCPKVPCAKEAGHSGLCGIRAPGEAPPSPLDLAAAAKKALGEMQWMITAVAMSRATHEDPAVLDAEKAYADLEKALAALPLGAPASDGVEQHLTVCGRCGYRACYVEGAPGKGMEGDK